MGSTLLAGLLRSGRDAADLVITGRNVERAEELAGTYGVRLMSNVDAAVGSDTLVLVVKPQDMGGLLDEISDHVRPGTLVVSLAAGITTAFLEERLPEGHSGRQSHAEHARSRRRGHGRDQPREALRRRASE